MYIPHYNRILRPGFKPTLCVNSKNVHFVWVATGARKAQGSDLNRSPDDRRGTRSVP